MNGAKFFLNFTGWSATFVGAMGAGLSFLSLVLPGETFTARGVVFVVAALAIAASALLSARQLGPGKRLPWFTGLAVQLVTAGLLGYGSYWAITADRPEGMLAVSGVAVGLVAIVPLTGLTLLLLSYPSSAPAEERTPDAHQP